MKLRKVKFVFISPILIFIFLFSKINITEFINCLKDVNITLLLLGLFIFLFANILIASAEWLRILYPFNCPVSLKEAIFIRLGSRLIKSFFPFRSGELFRAFYLKKQKGFPVSLGISSLAIQFMLDFLVLVFIMAFSYIVFIKPFYIAPFFVTAAFLCTLCIFVFKYIKKFTLYFTRKIDSRLHHLINTLFAAYALLKLKDFAAILTYSIIAWICELTAFIILFKASGVAIPVYAIFIFIPLVIIISNMPISVSGVGTREAALVFFFSRFDSAEKLLSSGMLISFVYFFLPLMLSLFFAKRFLNKLCYISETSKV